LTHADKLNLANNSTLDRKVWGLDTGSNWLSHTRTSDNLIEPNEMALSELYSAWRNPLGRDERGARASQTRSIDVMNRLNQTGGAGTTVVEGKVNELADVTVNNQPAELKTDLAGGGYRYSKAVAVTQGSNTVNITAVDKDNPPNTVSQNWQFNVPSVQKSFTYDANGNTLTDGTRTFTWDAKNRLKSVTVGASNWSWDYDYRDRRVKERLNGSEVKRFIWNDNDIVQERTGANAITRNHHFGGFADGTANNTKYLTTNDHLGHVREVIAASGTNPAIGTVLARYDYTPYQGPQKVLGTTVDASLLTISRYYHHAGSGLELALYRAYDPELGRWMSEDPLEEEGGINLYGFVGCEPLKRRDPLGLADDLTACYAAAAASRAERYKKCLEVLAGLGDVFGAGSGDKTYRQCIRCADYCYHRKMALCRGNCPASMPKDPTTINPAHEQYFGKMCRCDD
jgi:RHS repeat-associated protein